jgi:hypothetical protein
MSYDVMVRCPTLDKAVSTGIRCEIREFADLRPHSEFSCTVCGHEHDWSVEDAWLRDANFEKITTRAAERTVGSVPTIYLAASMFFNAAALSMAWLRPWIHASLALQLRRSRYNRPA